MTGMNRIPDKVKNALSAGVILIAFATLYWGVVPPWFRDLWVDPNYSHGLLVPFFSAYLVFLRRETLALFPGGRTGSKWIPLVIVGILLLVVGKAGGEFFTTRVSMVILIAGIADLLLGDEGLRVCRFPILFLIFMVPVPYIVYDSISFPLKLISSQLAEIMMSLSGLPVLREGNMITLPNIQMEVVDACSGIRSLMSLLATAAVASYYAKLKWYKVMFLLLLVILATIGLNSVRLYITGILSSWFGTRAAEGFLHDFSGWMLFMAGTVLISVASYMMREKADK
jgi:exosortase